MLLLAREEESPALRNVFADATHSGHDLMRASDFTNYAPIADTQALAPGRS